ncbi:asparaginase [Pelagerythrobacter sp.]|uniref:asparaginase n=1 Tax=Pelagerythrobacter sp. TaxID=2800702 RepID=UPI0035B17866
MNDTHLLVLATGGTIAGMAGSALRHDYRPGQIDIADYLSQVGELGLDARLVGRQIASIGSEDMDAAVWNPLHAAIHEALDDPACAGVIVTHGTDTAEETALLLDLTLPAAKPVVLVGAMRPADAVGYDGLRNFANAVRVAGDAGAAGRGVLVVMGDRVFAARDVRKARTRGTDAFRGFPRDAIGLVTPSALDWFGAPWRTGEGAAWRWHDALPEVPILYVHAGMNADTATRLVGPETRGLIVAGVGEGNMPDPLRRALVILREGGIVVVRSSRLDEGLVDREPEDDANGFVAARALNPQKARILLQVLLANGVRDVAEIQTAFDRR